MWWLWWLFTLSPHLATVQSRYVPIAYLLKHCTAAAVSGAPPGASVEDKDPPLQSTPSEDIRALRQRISTDANDEVGAGDHGDMGQEGAGGAAPPSSSKQAAVMRRHSGRSSKRLAELTTAQVGVS